MKKIILGAFLISIMFVNKTYAQNMELRANDDGQVILNAADSLDGNTYILNEVKSGEEFNVDKSEMTTFSSTIHNYTNGLLDNVDFTTTCLSGYYDNKIGNVIGSIAPSKCEIVFNSYYNFSAYAWAAPYVDTANFDFYKDDLLVYSTVPSMSNMTTLYLDNLYKANKIVVNLKRSTLYEMEFYGEEAIDYQSVANLTVNSITHDSANIVFGNPTSKFWKNNEIYLNNNKIYSGADNKYLLGDLKELTDYVVTIRSYYSDGVYVDVIKNFTTTKAPKDTTPPGNIKDLKVQQVNGKVKLTYTLPTDKDFDFVRIYKNNVLLESKWKSNEYIDENVKPNGNYTYKVVVVDTSGNVSSGITERIIVAGKEVLNLTAKANTFDQVDLSWKNPVMSGFETVKIYRKEQQNLVRTFFVNLFSADDGYSPLFETNGTIFKDLSVNADTKYTYKVTSVIDGEESEGMTVEVTTPKIAVSGGGIATKDDDYVISWTSPQKGKLKVVVGGVDYKIVNAADLKIVIPKADMKFDKFGNPDVQLVPVDDSGNEIGVPSFPGGGGATWGGVQLGDLGLDPKSLLAVVAALMGLIGLILLLAMSFKVAPRVIELIKNSFK